MSALAAQHPYAVAFVTYVPPPTLEKRLALVHKAGYATYIYDNSPDDSTAREVSQRLPSIRYQTDGHNAGLGVAITALCRQAFQDGFRALLFFDQDTGFDRETLDFVHAFLERHVSVPAAYGVVGFNSRQLGDAAADQFAIRDVMLTISSGSLILLDNAHRIGWHNPSYFVDGVDYEFCLRLSRHGLRVGECPRTPGFDHANEQGDETFSVLGRPRRLRRYPLRRVADSLTAYVRLLGSAVIAGQPRYALEFARLLLGYSWWALVARLASPSDRRST